MTMNRKHPMARVTRRRTSMLVATGALALVASCNNFDVQNLNAPTAETLTNGATRDVLARTAVGVQIQALDDRAGIIQQWGIYGREGWNLLGNDPRETGEEISGPQDAGGRAGGIWTTQYQDIRTINTYQDAIANTTALSETEKRAALGFSKTLKAWHLHIVALRSGPVGMPVDVNRPLSDEPAPLVTFDEAMAAASALMDEGLADLQAGGSSFPFTFVPGYEGFQTPATFAQFNRALAAKILVHRATFVNCTACWAEAKTAIDQSFVTTAGLPGSLKTGVYFGYTGAANEANNPVAEALTSNRYWVHPSIISGAQLRPNGEPDLRLTTKVALAPEARTLNDLTGTYKPVMYNDPVTLAPDLGADIPWITNEELLLLRAEIRWNTGDKPGAISDIDLVRVNAGGLAPTTLTAASPDAAFVTELLYNRLYSLMWTQGTRWIDARRYNRLNTLPIDRPGDVVHPNMLIPAAECDARGLQDPCSVGG
jgi:starch-binding outer membrane protein, SusD/RagB family